MSGLLRLPDIPPDLPLDRKAATATALTAWASLIMLSPVPEIAHAFAPCAVAAGFELSAHDCLYLVRCDAVLRRNLCETDMVGQRHFDDFAERGR
jgi:hypothetical protein